MKILKCHFHYANEGNSIGLGHSKFCLAMPFCCLGWKSCGVFCFVFCLEFSFWTRFVLGLQSLYGFAIMAFSPHSGLKFSLRALLGRPGVMGEGGQDKGTWSMKTILVSLLKWVRAVDFGHDEMKNGVSNITGLIKRGSLGNALLGWASVIKEEMHNG